MKNLFPSYPSHRNQGVALVLVLCFVVLITGLVVAYFSRTLTTRQLSNASTSTAQAEMLANSATDVILGDLKQEIVNGSIASTPPPATLPVGVTVYAPAAAAYAVPQRNPTPAPAIGAIPNLVRRSLRLDSPGKANAFPTPASSPAPAVSSRASVAASDTLSINGRSISRARWNRHYLIPTAPPAAGATPSAAASQTSSTPIDAFTTPDWVFVTAEKGPDVISTPFKDASGVAVTPTGRYAYAIYDEGGLLDVNQTGYPSASTPKHIGAKPGPSYADLTQLPSPAAGATAITAANVDSLLGWRNYATLQSTGAFPLLQPSSTVSDAAYYNLFTLNTINSTANGSSSLQVAPTVWNDKTDQTFLSRQQLINYLNSVNTYATSNNHPELALDLRYLQYLGTFSRGLNQPSYVQESNRPIVIPSTAGGNNAGDNAANPSTNITPNFLTARVLHAFANPNTRFDGTPVVIGEPLVKKRFPLNRLAWLTYKGPSVNRNLSDPDMAQLIANGITADFLKQGTADNVKTYFGLTWDSASKWTYVHNNPGPILNIINQARSPNTVVDQNPGREPDFFELLKASINPGSIAKTSLSSTINNNSIALGAQNQRAMDVSLDVAILQIGANIIDQFDTDSFPTQINYNIGDPKLVAPNAGVVYGVENLPYIERVRSGLLRLQEADPPECVAGSSPDTRPFKNTGLAALMYYPELWNPHDWSSNSVNVTESMGAVGPKNFTVYAQTTDYGSSTPDYIYVNGGNGSSYSANPNDTVNPGFNSMYAFPFSNGSATIPGGGETRSMSIDNTKMTFVMDTTSSANGTLFREPTVLFQPGVPGNINLTSPALRSTNAGLGHLSHTPGFFSLAPAGGLLSAVDGTVAPASPYTNKIPTKGAPYIGFYAGAHPLRWFPSSYSPPTGATAPYPAQGTTTAVQTQYGPYNDVTFVVSCDDGLGGSGTITYDVKALTAQGQPNGFLSTQVDSGFGLDGQTGVGNQIFDNGVRYFEPVDPRSSRFGMLDSWIQENQHSIPPKGFTAFSNSPVADNSLLTRRPGADIGDPLYDAFGDKPYTGGGLWFLSSTGWYHTTPEAGYWCYPGLLAQNNPSANGIATFYYADPDGVVRRASAGNVPVGGGNTNFPSPLPNTVGLPMAAARGTAYPNYSSAYSPTVPRQMDSRPVILNRPFRSVAELGYVYSGTPWRNLDFFMPESGDVAMLDVFCVNDNSDSNGMTGGQVDLNTQQVPVLQAILAGATKDLWNDATSVAGTAPATIVGGQSTNAQAQQIAQLLVNRTVKGPTSGPNSGIAQPLQNVSDLVGRWVSPSNSTPLGGINGQMSCDGFSADLATFVSASGSNPDVYMHNSQRYAESAIRALSNAGQTRVWNLMFDIVAQTGRFPTQATSLNGFNVEGEQHYWVHVAIDRYTGQVIDKQVEVVKE